MNSVKLIAGLNNIGKFREKCQTGNRVECLDCLVLCTDWCKIGLFGTVYRLVQNWIVWYCVQIGAKLDCLVLCTDRCKVGLFGTVYSSVQNWMTVA
jgi:hypothetical protein